MMGSGIVLLLQSLPVGIWWFGVLQVLIGSCIVGINPSLSAAVTLNTDPSFRGRMFGMTTTAQQFGSMLVLCLQVLYLLMLAYPMYLALQAYYCYIWHSQMPVLCVLHSRPQRHRVLNWLYEEVLTLLQPCCATNVTAPKFFAISSVNIGRIRFPPLLRICSNTRASKPSLCVNDLLNSEINSFNS